MCASWESRHSLTRRGQAASRSHTTTVRWIPTRGGLILPAGPDDALWEETDHHDGEREDHDLCGDLGPDAGHDRAGARDERGAEERSEQGTGPPTRMERKAGIKNPTPICGSTLMSGAMTAPARPASAAPKAKVIRSMRRVLRPRLLAIGRLAITARATRPRLVR